MNNAKSYQPSNNNNKKHGFFGEYFGTRIINKYENCFLKIVTILNRFSALVKCYLRATKETLTGWIYPRCLSHLKSGAELGHTRCTGTELPFKREWCLKQNVTQAHGPAGFVMRDVPIILKRIYILSHRDAILHYLQKRSKLCKCHAARNQLNKGLTYRCSWY